MNANFIPVAVNLYKIRQSKGADGKLFASVQRQKDQYQGIWIVNPDGKVLTGHQTIKDQAHWTEEVLATIDEGLRSFGAVVPRYVHAAEPLPQRGVGALPAGGVCLALYSRYVRGGGKHSAPTEANPKGLWMWEGELKPDGPPVIDSINLTSGEWKSLCPPSATVGTQWKAPESVARKLVRLLSPGSDQSAMPRPEEATAAELNLTVESVEQGLATIRLSGRFGARHVYDGKPSFGWASGDGAAVYDLKARRMRSLLLTFSGAYRMAPPWDTEDRPTGAVAEWRMD